jgi:hypothetical protein
MLMMAGVLDPKVFGPPVNLVSEPLSRRRSICGFIDRGALPELLTQFDFANPAEPNSRRAQLPPSPTPAATQRSFLSRRCS